MNWIDLIGYAVLVYSWLAVATVALTLIRDWARRKAGETT